MIHEPRGAGRDLTGRSGPPARSPLALAAECAWGPGGSARLVWAGAAAAAAGTGTMTHVIINPIYSGRNGVIFKPGIFVPTIHLCAPLALLCSFSSSFSSSPSCSSCSSSNCSSSSSCSSSSPSCSSFFSSCCSFSSSFSSFSCCCCCSSSYTMGRYSCAASAMANSKWPIHSLIAAAPPSSPPPLLPSSPPRTAAAAAAAVTAVNCATPRNPLLRKTHTKNTKTNLKLALKFHLQPPQAALYCAKAIAAAAFWDRALPAHAYPGMPAC